MSPKKLAQVPSFANGRPGCAMKYKVHWQLARKACFDGQFANWIFCGASMTSAALEQLLGIFSHTNIHKADWRLLRHTLRMISFHNATKSIHVSEITDSGVISTYMAFNECGPSPTADHLYTPRLLEEICDCLVTFRDDSSSSRRYATFAHYTVREFIESDRCASSPAAFFRSPPHEVEWDIITSSIGQLGGV